MKIIPNEFIKNLRVDSLVPQRIQIQAPGKTSPSSDASHYNAGISEPPPIPTWISKRILDSIIPNCMIRGTIINNMNLVPLLFQKTLQCIALKHATSVGNEMKGQDINFHVSITLPPWHYTEGYFFSVVFWKQNCRQQQLNTTRCTGSDKTGRIVDCPLYSTTKKTFDR